MSADPRDKQPGETEMEFVARTFNRQWHESQKASRNTGVNSTGAYPAYWDPNIIPIPKDYTNPSGIRSQANNQWGDDDYGLVTPWISSGEPVFVPDTTCECGIHKTYGDSVGEDQHSGYCPVYTRWMNEGKK